MIKQFYAENRFRPTGEGKDTRIVIRLRIGLKFIVVETRIETRLPKLETRVSSIELRDSIRASSPLNGNLSHETGFVAVAVTQNLAVL